MKFRTLCKGAFWLVATVGAGVVCLAVVIGPPTTRADFEKGTAGWFSPNRGAQVQADYALESPELARQLLNLPQTPTASGPALAERVQTYLLHPDMVEIYHSMKPN